MSFSQKIGLAVGMVSFFFGMGSVGTVEAYTSVSRQAKSVASYMMGVIYDLQGQTDHALQAFQKALRLEDNYIIHLRLGADYARLGQLEPAVKELNRVLKAAPENVQARYLLALIYSTEKKFEKAAEEYEAILTSFSKADPKNIEIYGYLGQLYYSQKEYDKAIQQYEIILSLTPKNVDVLFILGSLYLEVGNRDKAIELLRRAVQLDPDNDLCLNTLGYIYAEAGVHLDQARELIERALSIDPQNGAYLDSLGWVYFKQGMYEEALRYLREADALMKDPVIYEHMGDVYYRLQKYQDARKYYNLSLDLLPGQDRVIEKLDKLN